MRGRRPKPAHMDDEPNDPGRRTKADKKARRLSTIILGGKEFKCPLSVRKAKVAKAKWMEIMELYAEADLSITTQADVGLLERYCLTYWEYKQLLDAKIEATKKYKDTLQAAQVIHDLRLETKINQKNALLLKMDEQLFLTPLSKCRAIPAGKKKDPKKAALEKKGFNI